MLSLLKTPFKLTSVELMLAAAASVFVKRLWGLGHAKSVDSLCEAPQYGYSEKATSEVIGPRFVRITDIRAGNIDWASVPFCDCGAPKGYYLRSGDILIGRTGASIGKSIIMPEVPEPAIFASYLIRLRPHRDAVNGRYLYWCLQTNEFWDQILTMSRGSATKNINGKMLASLKFPVPREDLQEAVVTFLDGFAKYLGGETEETPIVPAELSKQRRIVEKIERVTAKIEEARSLRKDCLKSGQHLLSTTLGEVYNELAIQYGTVEFRKLSPHVTSGPRNWSKHYSATGSRFYRAQDVGPHGSILADVKQFLTPPAGIQGRSAQLEVGDLLVVITGATVGRVALFLENHEPGFVSQHVAICRLPKDRYLPTFALYGLLSPEGQEQLLGQKYGQGKPGLNLTNIRNIRLPCPPLEEQRRIIRYVGSVQSKIEEFKKLQAQTAAELDALIPSILDRAFRGEL